MKSLKLVSFMLIFFLLGCSSKQMKKLGVTYNELTTTGWQLKLINGVEVESDSYMKGLPELYFAEEGKLSGSTGCNQFMGTYKMDEKNLYLIAGATSKMACPGSGEVEFLDGLSQIAVGNIENKQLQLIDEVGNTHMVFRQIDSLKSH